MDLPPTQGGVAVLLQKPELSTVLEKPYGFTPVGHKTVP